MTDYTPEKVAELIVEARTFITPEFDCAENDLIRRLADALEAAEDMRAMTLMFMRHARAERDRYRAAIEEALAFESTLPAIATVPRRILTAALDKTKED